MSERGLVYDIRRCLQKLAFDILGAEFMSKVYYKIVLKRNLNLKKPESFNEKLQWMKLFYWPNNDDAVKCADKYSVREYLKGLGREDILNELLYVWDDAKDIDWDKLPKQFVLKCNHGCGYNIICADKNKLNKEEVIKKIDKWMHEDFYKFNAEPHYGKIKRKIICEKYLGDNVINYNIYCFNGKAVFFSLAGGLGDGVGEHLTYYYPDGSKAPFKNLAYPTKVEKLTDLLPTMISTAEGLSKNFPMVRVDLFDVNGKIILSELTFTPGGGLIPFSPVESDYELGKMLDISSIKI